jgi:uncharacterized membrane protein YfcA
MPEFTIAQLDKLIVAEVVAVVAGLIRGFTGFGGPAIMILILTQLYSPLSVLKAVILIDFTANLPLVPRALKKVSWRTAGILTAVSLLFVPIGLFFLINVNPLLIKRLIAIIVGICSLALLGGFRLQHVPSLTVVLAVGALSGAVVGATYIALPAMVFLFAVPGPPAINRANAIFWIFVISVAMVVVLIINRSITLASLTAAAVVGAGYLLGTIVGAQFFRGVKEKVFRRIVLYLLLALSLLGVLN